MWGLESHPTAPLLVLRHGDLRTPRPQARSCLQALNKGTGSDIDEPKAAQAGFTGKNRVSLGHVSNYLNLKSVIAPPGYAGIGDPGRLGKAGLDDVNQARPKLTMGLQRAENGMEYRQGRRRPSRSCRSCLASLPS